MVDAGLRLVPLWTTSATDSLRTAALAGESGAELEANVIAVRRVGFAVGAPRLRRDPLLLTVPAAEMVIARRIEDVLVSDDTNRRAIHIEALRVEPAVAGFSVRTALDVPN